MKVHRSAVAGFVVVALIVGLALVGLVWLPHEPNRTDVRIRFAGPSQEHWFGTDQFGRDIFSRVAVGARITLAAGLVAVTIGVVGGLLLGGVAAWHRGWTEEIAMRVADALGAFPPVLLAILLATAMGPGVLSGMLAIGVATIPFFARLIRSELLALRGAEFIRAALALGAGPGYVLWRHVWPHARAIVITQSTIVFAQAILAEAALSYLGLGTQPPHASWGRMLREAQDFLIFSAYPALFPGLAIALAVFGLNLLGDGLRDMLDPKARTE